MGRRDVREAILELNRDGVTIFYSSHLLSDVESISHRVAMIVDGRIVREGTVDDITDSCGIEYHVRTRVAILAKDLPEGVVHAGHPQEVICADDAARDRLLRYCLDNGIAVEKMDHKRPSLEDILTEEIARADA
jgi:ABC-2 type transport system ATP-binding protein